MSYGQGDTNPFSDPSVKNITGSQIQTHVDNFNPFTDDSNLTQVTVVPANREIIQTATDDLNRQQESLNAAADRIENWEPNMQSRAVVQQVRIKNYPPLPACCPIKPCFYQDISGEIPPNYQRIIRFHYYFWIIYSFVLIVNIAGCLAFLTAAKDQAYASVSFGISIGYFLVRMPCSYVCWFRPVYSAFRSDSSLNFFCYFFVFVCQIIILAVDSIGFFYYGTVGWNHAYHGFIANRIGYGIFFVVIAVLFDVLAIIGFILLTRVNLLYRRSGASFELAKSELNQNIKNNQFVRQTASDAAGNVSRVVVDGTLDHTQY